MGRKKKVATEEAKPEVKTFEYGDLVVICKCGRTQVITKGVDKGLQLVLTTREDSFIQLRCDECDADMKLCFIEGVKPEEPVENEPKTDESVPEESKQEPSL